MELPAPPTPLQFVFKVSALRLDVTVSSAQKNNLIDVAFVEGMAPLARKCLDPWSMPGKQTLIRKCPVLSAKPQSQKMTCTFSAFRPGYQDVVTIPAGATHIDVKQRSHGDRRPDNSFLAVRRQDGTYLLNGDYKLITLETDVFLKGALLRYSGSSASLERLRSFAPLPEPLTVQVLSVGDSPRPRVKYSYFAPRPASTNRHSINAIREVGGAEWTLREWGPCSQTCGEGTQKRDVLCLDTQGRPSQDCPEELRPTSSRLCSTHACPSWVVGEWSACSKTCGRGFRKRPLHCVGHDGHVLSLDKCHAKDRPRPLLDICIQGAC